MVKHVKAYLHPKDGTPKQVLDIENISDIDEAYRMIREYKRTQTTKYKDTIFLSIQKEHKAEDYEKEAA